MDAQKSSRLSVTMLAYLGFAILGLVNAIVPFIVHSANYLIIPYPRWIVLLIETLPALATKLLMPHVLHRVPYWTRPLTIGAGWIIVAIVTNVTPPNIAPPLRILTSVLASISAAAMEVSFLGMLRYYGRVGLAGWGAGVGAGAVFCAILPFVLTVWLESFLRDFIDCIYALAGAMLVAFFVVLPGAPVNYPHAQHEASKVDVEDASLLAQDPVEQLSRMLSTRNRLSLTKAMIRPFMMPLFGAFAIQALAYPGIARALPLPTSYTSFFSYFTTYGLAFQLGNFISRTHTLLLRPTTTKVAFTIIGASTFILLANSMFLVFSAEVLVGLLAFGAGLGGGAVPMIIFDRVLQDKSFESGINLEFVLQICDEGGPPCTNCLARNLEGCSYLTEPPTQLPATETRRRIELELMHRWTSSSYKSLASIPEDNQWLQEDMARWALKHEYLLQGMFAFSALEVALCEGAVVVEEDYDTYYAKLAVDAFEELHEGVLERMVTLWELLMGNASIANQHFDALISGALSRSTEALMLRTQLQTETPTSLSKETEEALESLSTIINKACETPSGSTPNDQSEAGVRISSYRTSFSAIQACFVQDSKDIFKGMAIGFPALAGRDFGLALKSSDPVALLLMVFWGVQLDTLGKIAWWVGTFGKKMVDEVSEMLWEPDPEFEVMDMSEWRECIAWARAEVGLTPTVETTEER
ncbi:Sterol uptake control 2 [Fusarium agapanthi]|uniref:Sterol uptake control 2 n=1 Tax=Fusarium agapanthi TaxID=1803897 RepID=A0A9P5B8H7_9HYPO|nr:Sterol uptake control 2 [Fusarium agapanthi]